MLNKKNNYSFSCVDGVEEWQYELQLIKFVENHSQCKHVTPALVCRASREILPSCAQTFLPANSYGLSWADIYKSARAIINFSRGEEQTHAGYSLFWATTVIEAAVKRKNKNQGFGNVFSNYSKWGLCACCWRYVSSDISTSPNKAGFCSYHQTGTEGYYRANRRRKFHLDVFRKIQKRIDGAGIGGNDNQYIVSTENLQKMANETGWNIKHLHFCRYGIGAEMLPSAERKLKKGASLVYPVLVGMGLPDLEKILERNFNLDILWPHLKHTSKWLKEREINQNDFSQVINVLDDDPAATDKKYISARNYLHKILIKNPRLAIGFLIDVEAWLEIKNTERRGGSRKNHEKIIFKTT